MRFIGIALFALTLVCTLPGLGERDFWPPDGARYGGVAREMFRGRDFAVPHLNGEVYGDKPPGYFWAVQGAAWFTGGVDEGTARLPSLWAAVVLVVLTGMVSARHTGAHAGFLTGMALLATWSFAWQARYAQLDLLFAAFISLAAFLGFRSLEDHRPKLMSLSFFILGLGVLVKGPLALLVLPLLGLWRWLGTPPRVEGVGFGRACLWGGCLLLLPVLGWLAWATHDHGMDYLKSDLLQRNVVDRVRFGLAHRQGWSFYLRRLPGIWAPWILLLPLLLSSHLRGLLGEKGRRLCGFSTLWIVFFVAIQSAFPGKRSVYTFIFCAPVAVLIGHAGAAAVHAKAHFWQRSWIKLILLLLGAVLLGLGIILLLGSVDHLQLKAIVELVDSRFHVDLASAWKNLLLPTPQDTSWNAFRGDLRLFALPLVLGALTTLVLTWRGQLDWALDLLMMTLALALALGFGHGAPWLDHARSRQDLAIAVNQEVKTDPLAIFRHTDEGLLYYLDRPLPELTGDLASRDLSSDPRARGDQLMDLAETHARSWLAEGPHRYLLIRRKDRDSLKTLKLDSDYHVVLSKKVGSKRWYDLLRSSKGTHN